MTDIKVALIDDHMIVMDGITSLLMEDPSIIVTGKTLNSDELFSLIEHDEPHIVMLDIFLPKPIGIEILKNIKRKYPRIKVIILSGNSDEDLISTSFREGASGYLTKNVEKDELLEAIHAVCNDDQYISIALEKSLSNNFINKARFGDKYSIHKLSGLTPRELDIIKLISEGLGYKEIAAQLGISTRTVEAHKNNILEKLELRNTIELVKFAIKNKLIDI
jgi:DNA-binding NarL/FixJ family response regulator